MVNEIQELKNYYLSYQNNELVFQSSKGTKSFKDLLKKYSGPAFVYDLDLIEDRVLQMKSELKDVKLFFAVKANPNLEILKLFLKLGLGADVVSFGEIKQAMAAGFKAKDIVYSGVGKTKFELNQAIDLDIYQINVESIPELIRIIELAKIKNKKVAVAFRLNPNISIETHPYIATGLRDNKFGIDLDAFPELVSLCSANRDVINVKGISLHLGSQMLDFAPLKDSLVKLKKYFLMLQQDFPECHCFDIGGGLGVYYKKQELIQEQNLLNQYAATIFSELDELKSKITNFEIQSEPGRWLVAHGGVLVSQVQYVKKTPYKNFVVIDTGMNHLLRPSLYEAYHEILPWQAGSKSELVNYEIVGPICESSDFLAKNKNLPEIKQDDFIIIADCGAYGASMSSDYNLQPRAQEIILK
jgi:diaminopimelate decarboxylase